MERTHLCKHHSKATGQKAAVPKAADPKATDPNAADSAAVQHLPTPTYKLTLCVCCLNIKQHKVHNCPAFEAMSPHDRYLFIRRMKYCSNCLSSSHMARHCPSENRCRVCARPHHTMLHFTDAPACFIQLLSKVDNTDDVMLLGTARCYVGDGKSLINKESTRMVRRRQSIRNARRRENSSSEDESDDDTDRLEVRTLLDSGSQKEFISANCCTRLGLEVRPSKEKRVVGISSTYTRVRGFTTITIQSRIDPETVLELTPLVVDEIAKIPHGQVDIREYHHLHSISLADDRYHLPGEIDILLGANIFARVLRQDRVKREPYEPIAIETALGYIVLGGATIKAKKPVNRM